MVDPRLALGMISSLSKGMRVSGEDAPRRVIGSSAPRRPAGTARAIASRMIDAEIYSAIRADFPGWDYDELLGRFDAFLGANPSELPRNYSKRFYGFVKEHHRRNKYRL